MDTSTAYIIFFFLTLALSWIVYQFYFKKSFWQDRFSEGIESFWDFIKYFAVIFVIVLVVIFSNNQTVSFIIDAYLSRRRHVSTDTDTSGIKSLIISLCSVFFGSMLLLYGFHRMLEFQLFRNVPRSKIRSASIGLVEVQGKVIVDQILMTPYSKSPCVYYHSKLQEYRRSYGSRAEWQTIATETQRIPFGLADETGQVAVDSTNAEFEIPDKKTGYINRDCEDLNDKPFFAHIGDQRYNESFLSPDDDVCVLGTLAIHKGNSLYKAIDKGSNNAAFIISHSSSLGLNDALKWQMLTGLTYGSVLLITGFTKILELSDLL